MENDSVTERCSIHQDSQTSTRLHTHTHTTHTHVCALHPDVCQSLDAQVHIHTHRRTCTGMLTKHTLQVCAYVPISVCLLANAIVHKHMPKFMQDSCMYIYMCICTHICMYICIGMYICICICTCICIYRYKYMYVCTYVYMYVCIQICMYVCL